jgi:hypothetical protein
MRLDSGVFNVGLVASSCTALPREWRYIRPFAQRRKYNLKASMESSLWYLVRVVQLQALIADTIGTINTGFNSADPHRPIWPYIRIHLTPCLYDYDPVSVYI